MLDTREFIKVESAGELAGNERHVLVFVKREREGGKGERESVRKCERPARNAWKREGSQCRNESVF